MNIKKATIVGVLQDWDLYGYRFDIEQVAYNVPLAMLDSYNDEELEYMVEQGWVGNGDWSPLATLLQDLVELGWFEPYSRWEFEDPCELKLEIEEEE